MFLYTQYIYIIKMSVASLAGYLANVGGGGGGNTLETITIGESGTDVELSCILNDKLNVIGITTRGVDRRG